MKESEKHHFSAQTPLSIHQPTPHTDQPIQSKLKEKRASAMQNDTGGRGGNSSLEWMKLPTAKKIFQGPPY